MTYCVVFGCSATDITKYEKDNKELISFGGKGGNQAVALSKAGIRTVFLTKLSSLKEDKNITNAHLKNFKQNKVNTRHISFEGVKNDFTKVTVSQNGDNTLDEVVGISRTLNPDYVYKKKKILKKAKFVLIQLKVPIETTKAVISVCNKAKVKVVLTPCRPQKVIDNFDIIENVDYITCNEHEAKAIFGKGNTFSKKELHEVLKKYPNKLIVTLGKKGVKFFDGEKIVYVKALKVPTVIDTTGAGDTFCSNFVACLMEGSPLLEAVQKGVCASSIKIQSHGTQNGMPKKKERDRLYNQIYIQSKGEKI